MKQSRPKYSEFVNHIRNPEHKCIIASKVTIGNHNLKIETGRFTILKTPEDLRNCDLRSLIQL